MRLSGSADFDAIGAARFRSVLNDEQVTRVAALFEQSTGPGKRLRSADVGPVADLVALDGPIGRIAAALLGARAMPVRGLLLDKSEAENWALGWHQDRTIAVRERVDLPAFGPWSTKAGQIHVQPPHVITARMVTLRVHLDPVDEDNAPLLIFPGSHLMGRLSNEQIDQLASVSDSLMCLAGSGDVWAYRTAVVHASAEQRSPGRRRVLQIDYSADDLPGGLEWQPLV